MTSLGGAPNRVRTSGTSPPWFSAIAMIVRPTATAVPLSVCTGRGPRPPPAGSARLSRRAWKSVVFEHEVSSR